MSGVKGQKWGVRNWQNPDGSYTAAGLSSKPGGRYNQSQASNTSGGSSSSSGTNKGLASSKVSYYKNSDKTKKAWEYMNKHQDMTVGTLIWTNSQEYRGKTSWESALTNGHDWDWQEQVSGLVRFNEDDEIDYVQDSAQPLAWMIANGFDLPDKSLSGNSHIDRGIDDSDVASVNPGFGSAGTVQNCAKCSSALLLRTMGYEVEAGRQSYPSTSDAAELWWNGATHTVYDDASDWDADVASAPNSSMGTCSIYYPTGGGHAMAWSKDANGTVKICDGQNGRTFSSLSEASAAYGAAGMVQRYDMTNATPNWDAMGNDGVIRKASASYNTDQGSFSVNGSVYNKYNRRRVDTW